LIETVTVVEAPAARVPVVVDRVVHAWVFEAVQSIEVRPELRRV
jgi:hypothetical protein